MLITGRMFQALVLVLAFVFLLYAYRRAKEKEKPFGDMRPLAPIAHIDEAVGRAAEMGRSVHFTHGDGNLYEATAGQMLAGLSVLGKVAESCAKYNVPMKVISRYPEVNYVSLNVVREAYLRAGHPERFDPEYCGYVSPDYFAWSNEVVAYILREKPGANFLIGYFLGAAVYLAESGVRVGAMQIGGSAATGSFFFAVSCDYFLIGEELLAAGAYASGDRESLAGIAAQDLVKAVLLAVIIAGVIDAYLKIGWVLALLRS